MVEDTKTEDEGLTESILPVEQDLLYKLLLAGEADAEAQADAASWIKRWAARITSLEGELDTWKRARLESEEVIRAIVAASGARSEKHDIIQHVAALLARAQALEGELEEARKNFGSYKDMLANADIAAQNAELALSTFKQRASVEEMAAILDPKPWAWVARGMKVLPEVLAASITTATALHAHLFPSEKNNG